MEILRLNHNPIISPELDESIGENINGPSLIRVPKWVKNSLGRYYLYFAHHSGKFIRLAYANALEGPWTIYKPGTLDLEKSYCTGHIASPDVHIDNEKEEIIMFYHGKCGPIPNSDAKQGTKLAISKDGINFTSKPEVLGRAYWRCFPWKGNYYAVTMSGIIYRSEKMKGLYEGGPDIFRELDVWQRHMAVKLVGDTLYIFYSIKEDTPEHIVVSKLDLKGDWKNWKLESHESVLKPETDYEGGDLPLEKSRTGAIHQRVRQLRDPAIYEEEDKTYMLYSIAGERGIAIAEVLGL